LTDRNMASEQALDIHSLGGWKSRSPLPLPVITYVLTGGDGLDWFLVNKKQDTITDKGSGERVN
jgi:hypothetical protein